LLIYHLPDTKFVYGKTSSIFIEEPSTHLFPKEQKETIEYIVTIFKKLQADNELCRFFISTHSPYVLNVINNILDKGRLLKLTEKIKNSKEKDNIKRKIADLPFPDLAIDDISAYMIEDDGIVKSMIIEKDEDKYLYSDDIEKITLDIAESSGQLLDLSNEITDLI
jgi:hypothetical protein